VQWSALAGKDPVLVVVFAHMEFSANRISSQPTTDRVGIDEDGGGIQPEVIVPL
jgi:hypothetical protein